MKELYLPVDSSDEELEETVIKNITKINYNNYLLTNILNIKSVHNSDEFKTKLGLILHNLADRLFRSPAINNIYQKIKAQKLNSNENINKKILADIKIAFNNKLSQLFTDDNKENTPLDKDYIQLFNFVFDKNISIPEAFTLKKNIKITDAKEILLKELQAAKINLKPLYKNPLNIEIETSNSKEILACSQLTNRNNKNKIKYSKVAKANNYNSSTIYNLSNTKLEVFTDTHVIHPKTGNLQTIVFGLTTYNKILQEISKNNIHKEIIVRRIFEVIQNKETTISELELSQKLNNFAEQLAHLLFVVEMQRNNATFFTAPMFLELITKDEEYLKCEKFFPMSAKTAVAQARGVIRDYSKELPNTHTMDYDEINIKNGDILLKREGNIVIKWLSEIIGSNKLNYMTQIFDTITLVEIIGNKKINRTSIKELQNFLEDIDKIEGCPNNLLIELKENLNNLIPNFGKRSEQYLNLAKENLLKKNIFTKDLKDLIEVTYSIFQDTLNKLEGFLLKTQAKLAADVEQILPEVLTILCKKIKEWYNIDAPEYIIANKITKNTTNDSVLKDITTSYTPAKSLKISFANPHKKRDRTEDKENDNHKVFKILTEKVINNSLNIMDESPVIGEEFDYGF